MKLLVKLFLIVCIAIWGAVSLRIYTLGKGISKFEYDGDSSFWETLETTLSIENIEYYKSSISSDERTAYKVYIETTDECYLLNASKDEVDAFKIAGFFSENVKPKAISPLPVYVYGIAMAVILLFPTRRKK